MKLSTFQTRIPTYYKSGISIYLRGRIGRGKSTVIENAKHQLAKAFPGKRFCVVVIQGPLLNPPDAVGYLLPRQIGEHLESVFTNPFWFRTDTGEHIDDFDGCIVLVEEADKMDADVKKIMGEMALSGRLGPHKLKAGQVVWFAGNLPNERSGGTKEYDHLINRRMEILLDDDLDSFIDFLDKNNIHPTIKAFAASNFETVFMSPPEKQGPWMTPRSLVQAARFVQMQMNDPLNDPLPDDPITKEEVRGLVGDAGSAQMWATIQLAKEMPKLEDIIANPKKVKVPERADAQMLVCYTLAARADADNIEPLMVYIERMPAEFTITFGKATVNRDYNLINTKAFGDWVSRNATLMMATTDAR
jgi:hypothetical protein